MATEYEAGVRDALLQARELLTSQNSPDAPDGREAAERALECAFQLLESVYTTVGSGKSVILSSSDSTVVKATLELVVRWGIYPHLSPGVGIPLEKRFGEKSAVSAATALTKHVSGEGSGSSGALPQPPAKLSNGAPTSLLQSAELLAGLLLDSPQKPSSAPPERDGKNSNNPVSEGGESLTTATQLPAAALNQLVLFHHLPDLCAAFIQLSVSGKEEWKKLATERMNEMVRALPVAHMVEALLTLLGPSKPAPPTWLKEKAGRMLSRLLLREGGVAASMERLVGGIQEGNVKAYEQIASHLAKVPKYITTTPAYYEAVCPQLPPLFLGPLPGHEGGIQEGTSAARLVVNMHHTAIIMACKLASRDANLCGTHLFTPLLSPLLRWGMRAQTENLMLDRTTEFAEKDSSCPPETHVDEAHGESEENMESSLLNAMIGAHIFLTSGHDGADSVRQFLLPHIEPIIDALVALKVSLEPAHSAARSKQVKQGGASRYASEIQAAAGGAAHGSSKTMKPAFEKGFLENSSLGYATAGGPPSILERLRAALSDIAEILLEENPVAERVPSNAVTNAVKLAWPRHVGEIWATLNPEN